jgi:hypothetical protein
MRLDGPIGEPEPAGDADVRTPLGSGMENSAQQGAMIGIFVLGNLLGTIQIGLALWRARVVPTVVAIGLAVSQPIHLASVLPDNRPLDLVGWGLTAVGFAAAGWVLLRTLNDEFDLPPLTRATARE